MRKHILALGDCFLLEKERITINKWYSKCFKSGNDIEEEMSIGDENHQASIKLLTIQSDISFNEGRLSVIEDCLSIPLLGGFISRRLKKFLDSKSKLS